MKMTILIALLVSVSAFSQTNEKKKDLYHKDKMDYGDKQLLNRDVCRKPLEALETKYANIKKEELEKMKEKCGY